MSFPHRRMHTLIVAAVTVGFFAASVIRKARAETLELPLNALTEKDGREAENVIQKLDAQYQEEKATKTLSSSEAGTIAIFHV